MIPARPVEEASHAPAIPRSHSIENGQPHRRPFVCESLMIYRADREPFREGIGRGILQGRMISEHERLPDPFEMLANRRSARRKTASGETRLARRDSEESSADGREDHFVPS